MPDDIAALEDYVCVIINGGRRLAVPLSNSFSMRLNIELSSTHWSGCHEISLHSNAQTLKRVSPLSNAYYVRAVINGERQNVGIVHCRSTGKWDAERWEHACGAVVRNYCALGDD